MKKFITSIIAAVSIFGSTNVSADPGYSTTISCYANKTGSSDVVYYNDFSARQSLPADNGWSCFRDKPIYQTNIVSFGFHCRVNTNPSAPYYVFATGYCYTDRPDTGFFRAEAGSQVLYGVCNTRKN